VSADADEDDDDDDDDDEDDEDDEDEDDEKLAVEIGLRILTRKASLVSLGSKTIESFLHCFCNALRILSRITGFVNPVVEIFKRKHSAE
tara:strand:- start:105 stop:371 length:267 start_codon:yes stop_codon:yes gene_type:complete